MKHVLVAILILVSASSPCFAKERFADLKDYATRAENVCVCVVDKDNGDGTVTATVITSV